MNRSILAFKACWLSCILSSCLVPARAIAQDLPGLSKEPAFRISGMIDARSVFYSIKGIPPRRSPFSYLLSGSPVLHIYGLQLPFSFTYSEQQRSFSQPFNQFGVSPSYKWVTLHAGYRNVSFSPYTLDGYTLLGGGVELHPGKWRIGYIMGRLNRATTIDTTTGATQPFSFSRKGMALRLGYGDDRNFFDLSFLKARDDSNSVKTGAGKKDAVRPAGNAVGSAATKISIGNFFLKADGALSLYTTDIGSPEQPLLPAEWTKQLASIVPVNATSIYALAYTGALGYSSGNFTMAVEYRHIDPGFQSMGAYFFNDDLENYSLTSGFSVLKNKLRFNGSIGWQQDNLHKQKEATSRRIIGMANISWELTQRLGVDVNYSNFSSQAKPVVVQVQHKYLLAQTNHNLSVNPRYIIPGNTCTQVILVSYNYAAMIDANTDTVASNIFTHVLFGNYNLSFPRRQLMLTTGVNQTINTLAIGRISNYGVSLGVQKAWAKSKWQTGVTNAFTWSSSPGAAGILPTGTAVTNKSTILNLTVQTSYRAARRHLFGLRGSYTDNHPRDDKTGTQQRFTEATGELGYTFSF